MLKKLLMSLAVAAAYALPYAPDSMAAEMRYAPKMSVERGVKVTVTPQKILREAKTWDFRVVLESHTHDLSDDVAKSAVLIADGRQYIPAGWEGAPPGGHHRKGLLRFKAIVPKPAFVELQIRLAGESSSRSFKWALK